MTGILALSLAPLGAHAQSAAFFDGQAARINYEDWISKLQGDARAGAEFWAGQRSLKKPVACSARKLTTPLWMEGCQEAVVRFAPIDARRLAQPDYRSGWNSLPASTAPGSTAPSDATAAATANCTIQTAEGVPSGAVPPALWAAARECETRRDKARAVLQQQAAVAERMRAIAAAQQASEANLTASQPPSIPTSPATPAALPTEPELEQPVAPPMAPSPVQAPVPQMAPSGDVVVAQWSGSGNLQTRPFHVDGAWEIQWKSSDYLSIWLHPVERENDKDLLTNGMGPQNSSAYEPKGGDYYLQFGAGGPWSATVVSVARSTSPKSVMQSEPPAAEPARPASGSPLPVEAFAQQARFLGVVDTARHQFASAGNEMAQGAARPMRASSICDIVSGGGISNWAGIVAALSTNGDGKGVISLQVGPDVYFKTWNNSLSDINDHTLIDSYSTLFPKASSLRIGQRVRFSAQLIPSVTDCYKESSITLAGSIQQPEFIMRLTDIAPFTP